MKDDDRNIDLRDNLYLELEEGLRDEKLENFEERYGSTEDFSKRAVGALFEKSPKARTTSKFGRKEPDPEEQYATYIQSTRANIRAEEERRQMEREEAARLQEQQLAELSEIARRRESRRKPLHAQATGGGVGHAKRRQKPGMPPLNIRNAAAVGLFAVLVVFVVLVLLINSSRSQLAQANEQIVSLEGEIVEHLVKIEGLEDEVNMLEGENERLLEAVNRLTAIATGQQPDLPPADYDTDEPGRTDITANLPPVTDAPTQRTHVVQANENLFALANRFLGAGNRYPEIMQANNLTTTEIYVNMVLIIPD